MSHFLCKPYVDIVYLTVVSVNTTLSLYMPKVDELVDHGVAAEHLVAGMWKLVELQYIYIYIYIYIYTICI